MLEAISALITPAGARTFTYCAAGFTFSLGVFSIYHFAVYARIGKPSRMGLRLPNPVRDRIHRIISSRLASGKMIAGTFITGCFRFACRIPLTGQIYLPTLL